MNTYVVVLVTADKGLCGALQHQPDQGRPTVHPRAPGQEDRAGHGWTQRPRFLSSAPGEILARIHQRDRAYHGSSETAAAIARELMDMFTAEGSTIDRVFLIYNEFKSAMSQTVTSSNPARSAPKALKRRPPPERAESDEPEVLIDYLYEQPPAEILGSLLPRLR